MIQKDLSLRENGRLSRYLVFSREEWAQLRDNTPLTLSEESLKALRSLNDPISLQEVEHIYLPLSRLLQLYVAAVQKLYTVTSAFLGSASAEVPLPKTYPNMDKATFRVWFLVLPGPFHLSLLRSQSGPVPRRQ